MLVILFTLCFFALGSFAGAPSNSSGCLCTYGHPCWPTPDQFAELESQVSQPLIYPVPTASACYPANDPSGNCTQVMQRWTDGNWRSSIPGSMAEPNFESFVFKNGTISACYLNTSLGVPCEQGSVPVIGVDARTPQDIQAAVNFALRYNLKLVVKSTGHDYLGRSTGRGAFVVWTHKMKNITYDAEFAPEGAPANETYQAMTVGSGVQWHEAYDVANQNGRMMVGAQDPDGSIGAGGGWFQGGGHSSLSPSYGLGVDNVVQLTVVTSTGAHLTINNYQYPDLFWALRGGGGGTYGIVTSVTYRTYQQLPVVLYFMQANVTNTTAMKELIGGMLRLQPDLTDDGWSGYGFFVNTSATFIGMNPGISTAAANASTQPLTDYWLSLESKGISLEVEISPFDTWYAWHKWFQQLFSTRGEDGTNMMVTSRLLSRDILVNQYADVSEILSDCQGEVNMVAGGKVAQISPDSAGLNPAWRNAIVETACGVFWAEGATAEEISGQIDQLKVWIKDMYVLSPQSGAYFNEASLFEIDWQYTFFGSHYGKLKEIKDKYDPYHLFVVAEGVGSEEWNEELTCRW
ncbi:hypothetical protein F5J12DRAFT_817299 [Pisolithus orientalis]|uniref:uncharacterized protein n=1 Tax=Pisolithus orientalis TaxID=936130 RepID=UPI0022257C97|nr:uncharacterized protein F5J12DRAFT_817299 [Pisolithus orientalis]KAI6015297.1 hypothetical protein F5J12DRAFT_817299 [Pisolithus orientalis]